MRMANAYTELLAWKRARSLAIDIFRVTREAAFRRDWALRDQLRRSALSVPSNIAEGNERGSDRDCTRFLYFARGSLAELCTQVDIAREVGMLEPQVAAKWMDECDQLGRMVMALIRHRSKD